MDPLEIFENFKLDTLDDKWSDEVWDREFVSFPEPPVEYSILLGSEDMELFLKETRKTLKKWMADNQKLDETHDQERSEVSWQTLTALNINIRGLLAVLGYLMKMGQAAGADEDSRQACLACASLYLTLLSIPGSSTFHVFHPHLYHHALETLKLCEHLVCNRKHQRAVDLESLYGEQPAELLRSEKKTLIEGLNSILFELITLQKTFYMKYHIRSLEITVMNLVELIKLEIDKNVFETNQSKLSEASLTSLTYNSYVALQDLCDPRHGDPENTIRLIMKYLMPCLCPNILDLPAKAANIIWDTIILFLKNLLNTQGSAAKLGMEILIQNLLATHPDRSEPRQKQAGTVAKLINICQGEMFCKSITNLVLFCFNSKVSYRVFGQEVIARLLTDLLVNMTGNELEIRKKTKAILIATALSRCIDVSSMVRGKAMSIVESVVNNDKLKVEDFLNMSEEEKPLPSLNDLLEALEEDINPLPGPSTFNSILLNRIADERALVRRSAIHAIQNIVTHFPPLVNKVAPTLGKHCRDPALSVRRDAIQALATLLENNSGHEMLLHEYIKSVLPRIYDVEVKVQEKVLETLQNLVLDKIKPLVEEADNEAKLPWKIINLVTALKMRKNLSKICEYWVKNGIITNSLISRVQTHIGTHYDMESWVLLAIFAENTKLTNMKKYFEDYKKLLEGKDFVTYLKLEVLSRTWQGMGRDFLEDLHKHIFECLCKFRVNVAVISVCLDLLSGITKRLNPSSGNDVLYSYACNLMKLSEAQIDKLPEEEEQLEDEAVDLYLKAFCTLGHASFLCTAAASESSLSIVQSLLLDCSNIPTSAQNAERLKAASIILLGQQAMRDREFAETVMPILGQLMSKSDSSKSSAQAAVRINAVKALADLCVRFTALVEPFLPDMCICMKDPNPQVREAIIVIFVQLLLEDFIKVKGAFFYHILTMLSDDDETIRELTVFLIKQRLLAKNKNLISQSFVKSIFHYNNCQTKNKFNDRMIRSRERDALILPGNKNQAKRRIIYNFMMEHLDPPSKIKILTKLNSEVFEAICEDFISIKHNEVACVLKDVMYIVSNERMQATYGSKIIDDENQDEAATAFETQTSNAINIIVEGMKKFKKEIMFRTLIRLREFLTSSKSLLLVDVSKFFIKFLSDFNKDQLAEMFSEHAELRKEVDHDISIYGKRPEDEDEEDEEEDEAVSEADSGVEQSTVNRSATEDSESESSKRKDINANLSTKGKSAEKKLSCSPKKIQDIAFNNFPKIVLRRLSTLTYPGIKAWKSPPREETNCSRLSDPGPSSSGISVSSQITTESTTASDSSESESISSPRPKKIPRYSEDTSDVDDS